MARCRVAHLVDLGRADEQRVGLAWKALGAPYGGERYQGRRDDWVIGTIGRFFANGKGSAGQPFGVVMVAERR